jgi:hypothetical protein
VRSWLAFSNPFDEDVIFLSTLMLAFYINYFKLNSELLGRRPAGEDGSKKRAMRGDDFGRLCLRWESSVGNSGKGLQMYAVGLALSFINQIWKACLEWTHRRPFGISDEAAGG